MAKSFLHLPIQFFYRVAEDAPMLYARTLTDEERQRLRRMARQEVGRVSQRALIVLLSEKHKSVPELAAWFDTSRATVRFWIHRFNISGLSGLYDAERCGRPCRNQAN